MQTIPVDILQQFLKNEVNEVLPDSPNENMFFYRENSSAYQPSLRDFRKNPADQPRPDRSFNQSLWGRR